jgi:hypothetical protein
MPLIAAKRKFWYYNFSLIDFYLAFKKKSVF